MLQYLIIKKCATAGSTCCYFVSRYLAKKWIKKTFPDMIKQLELRINRNRSNLFFYLLFLRISPILPNWFINIASPIVNIPWHVFTAATFLGLIPANYIHINTGIKLSVLGSESGSAFTNFIGLFVLGLLALLPTIFKKKFNEWDAKSQGK
jgi:uncharacterized membrane protein YdjX (TVP38/TMEM64 family)